MLNFTLTLIVGLGVCVHDGDWCPHHPAKIALENEIAKRGSHSFHWNIEHMSNFGDGELRRSGDRGVETGMIEYRYEFKP